MATVDPIKIIGLREFQTALKEMGDDLPRRIRVALNSVAETVLGGARRRVPSRTGRARASLKVSSSQREARIKGGAARVPYYGWLDFGGRVGRGRTGPNTGSVRRPFIQSGRYMYPAYSANRDSIHKALEQVLVDLAEDAGLEVTT